MKKIILAMAFVGCFVNVFCQNTQEIEQIDIIVKRGTDEQGYKSAINVYTRYISDLSPKQLGFLGFSYWKLEDYKPALKYFEIAASLGDSLGIYYAGLNYYNGNGTIKNFQKSYNYLSRLINSTSNYMDYPNLHHLIAHCFENGANFHGILGDPDYESAIIYFTIGAKNGDTECMLHLGDYYNNSDKIKTDLVIAKKWYKKACESDYKPACEKLLLLSGNSISH